MYRNTLICGAIAILLIAGVAFFLLSETPENTATNTPTTTPSGATTTPNGTATTSAQVSRVQLAMLDTTSTKAGKARGCDRVVLVSQNIATTTAPLAGAMQALFAISTTSVGGLFNYIDRTNETLKFDRATIINGTANIYLTGSLTGLAGVCDDPRAQIQIEETALAFSTVQRVNIYLNGTKTNLTPSQQ